MKEITTEQLNTISNTAYALSGSTIAAGLTLDEWSAIASIVGVAVGSTCAIAMVIVTVYFKKKYLALEVRHKQKRSDYTEKRG